MNLRFLRKKSPGQSLPIIALVIVVIVGMVALSVDLGNTYAKQRTVVRAAEAATVSAMDVVVDGATDSEVASALYASLNANGIYTDTYTVKAVYRDQSGEEICEVGSAECDLYFQNTLQSDIAYIDIKINGENDTFFASVLGQDELPLNASSFAGQCAPTTGVYPIAISPNSIGWVRDPLSLEEGGVGTQMGFLPPEIAEMEYYFIYSSGGGDNFDVDRLRQRRIYLNSNLDNGGTFSYLRWRSDQSGVGDVQAMFHVDGNLEEGLEEEAVPSGTTIVEEGELSPGSDWLSSLDVNTMGDIDLSSAPIADELEYHVTNRTLMILPIIDSVTPLDTDDGGEPTRYAYHMSDLGNFLLTDYGKDEQGRQFLDLVYVSEAEAVACPSDPVDKYEQYGISGRVRIEPLAENELAGDVPTQFVLVMDVSGSMNLNFLGQGSDNNNNPVQCDKSGDPALDRYITNCEGGASSQYYDPLQRRNAVVKHALIDHFAERMRPIDAIGLVSYSTSSNIEYYEHQSTSPEADLYSGGKQYWFYGDNPADRARLEEVILQAGARDGDPYVTGGSTGAARGLRDAADLLNDADQYGTRTAPATMPDTPYKRVVIFLTDGVANIFLDKVNGHNGIAKGRYDDNCPEGEEKLTSSIPCNMGVLGPPDYSPEVVLPVTAMINQSQGRLQTELEADVFALAVGQVGEMGLVDVASQQSFFTRAARADQIDSVFNNIRRQAVVGCGVVGVPGRWLDTIPAAGYPLDSPWADAAGNPTQSPPSVDLTANPKIVGYITIKPRLGMGTLSGDYRIPIQLEQQQGTEIMRFSLDQAKGLPAGDYDYTAFVAYKGADGVSRLYSSIYDVDEATVHAEGSIHIPSSDRKDVVLEPIHLKLPESEALCSSETDVTEVDDGTGDPGTGDNPTDNPTQETTDNPTQETTDDPTDEPTQEASICEPWTSASGESPVTIGLDDNQNSTYEATFTGTVNNGDGTSTWNYEVSEVEGRDLSHWTLPLPACVTVTSGFPSGYEERDPSVDPAIEDAIKWNVAEGFDSGTFQFTIDASACEGGSIEVGSTGAVMKAGPNSNSGSITAPVVCTP